ncbi:allatostatin receptor, putative [Ixodes scapularis]|uniref:Allatostatin receptor, putative n=1 Tax=Ixodes scapularis TaxID=6945 RepID=B7P1G5_IXOSC|nr:allatostatin receptor, putative [Ixodes scapularis]|eukprot:XP_002433373.1 allatostatin receptor, putative [Ixodes scapularis]
MQEEIPTTPMALMIHGAHTTLSTLCNGSIPCEKNTSGAPSLNSEDDYTEYYQGNTALEEVLAIVVPVLFGAIAIVGFFGNALVVLVVLCNPQMRSTTNILIINLAMADLLFIVFCVPFTGWDYTLDYWPFGDVWCRIVQYLVIVCAYASIYTLVLMSFDRFLAVVHPITSMSIRTERNAYLAIFLTWVMILLACIPALFSHGMVIVDDNFASCTFLAHKGYSIVAFQICFFMSSFVVPLALVFILYVLMLKRLWFGVTPGGRVSAESVRSKRRVTRLVVVVVVVFAVCWCPVQIVLVLKSVNLYGQPMNPPRIVVQIASQILAYTNSCVNPFLYAFLSENFRKSFRKIIFCCPRSVTSSGSTRTRIGDENERTERETTATCITRASKISNDIM